MNLSDAITAREAQLLGVIDAQQRVIASLLCGEHAFVLPPSQDAGRDAIIRALRDTDWRQDAAAARLGISQRVLNYRMERLGIPRPVDLRRRLAIAARA